MDDSTPGVRHLRAMSVTELIDATITLYRQNFALFAGVVALLAIPQTILSMIFVALLPGPTTSSSFTTGSTVTYDRVTQAYSTAAAHSGGTGLIGIIFTVLITGALAQAVAARYLDDPETVLGAYTSTGVQPFVRLFLALLLAIVAIVVFVVAVVLLVILAVAAGSTALAIIVGVLASFVGLFIAIFVVPHLYLVPQVIVLEGRGVLASVRRSWFLVRGYYWHVVGLVFLVSLMVGIVSGIITVVVSLVTFGNPVLQTGLSGVISLLLQPVSLGATTLLYFDQRVRKEAFDLEYEAARSALPTQ